MDETDITKYKKDAIQLKNLMMAKDHKKSFKRYQSHIPKTSPETQIEFLFRASDE